MISDAWGAGSGVIVIDQANLSPVRLAARRIGLEVTEAATAALAHQGYDPAFGARPLKRVIQRQLDVVLAVQILDGKIAEGDTSRSTPPTASSSSVRDGRG